MDPDLRRLCLTVRRHALPEVRVVFNVSLCNSPTIANFLEQVNDIIPLESDDWGLDDYVVELRVDQEAAFECLHFQPVATILKPDEEVLVRPLFTSDRKKRVLSGRHQISAEGKHLIDGVPFGRPLLRTPRDRPPIDIPPLKKRRITYEPNENEDENDEDYQPLFLTERGEDEEEEEEHDSSVVRTYPGFDDAGAEGSDEGPENNPGEDVEHDVDDLESFESEPEDVDMVELDHELRELWEENATFKDDADGGSRSTRSRRRHEKPSKPETSVPEIAEGSRLTLADLDCIACLHIAFPTASSATCEKYYIRAKKDITGAWLMMKATHEPSLDADATKERSLNMQRLAVAQIPGIPQLPLLDVQPAARTNQASEDEDESSEDESVSSLVKHYDENGFPAGSIAAGTVSREMARSLQNRGQDVKLPTHTKFEESDPESSDGHDAGACFEPGKDTSDEEDSDSESDSSADPKSDASSSSDDDAEGDDNPSSSSSDSDSGDETQGNVNHEKDGHGTNDVASSSSSDDDDDDDDSNKSPEVASSKKKAPKAESHTDQGKNLAVDSISTSSEDDDRDTESSSSDDSSDDSSSDSEEDASSPIPKQKVAPASKRSTEGSQSAPAAALKIPPAELQRTVPPFGGTNATRKRNERRRAQKQGLKAQKAGHAESASPSVEPPENVASDGLAEEVQARKEALLRSVVTLPAQMDPDAPAPAPESEAASPKPVARTRLDIGASRRHIFAALGVRNPKNKADENKIRDKLMKDVRPHVNPRLSLESSYPTGHQPPVEDDPEAWRNKIAYRAVECCDDEGTGVDLGEPPFPFDKSWGRGKRQQRNHVDDRVEHQPRVKRGCFSQPNSESDIILNYDDVDVDHGGDHVDPGLAGLAPDEKGAGEGPQTGRSQVTDTDDLPALPQDLSTLPSLSRAEVCAGMVMTWKQLSMSKATNWQPQVSNVTAVVMSAEDDSLRVILAKRDRGLDRNEKKYDADGNRVYDKFEAPDVDDDEEDENGEEADGYRTVQFAHLMDARIVQQPPVGLVNSPAAEEDVDMADVPHSAEREEDLEADERQGSGISTEQSATIGPSEPTVTAHNSDTSRDADVNHERQQHDAHEHPGNLDGATDESMVPETIPDSLRDDVTPAVELDVPDHHEQSQHDAEDGCVRTEGDHADGVDVNVVSDSSKVSVQGLEPTDLSSPSRQLDEEMSVAMASKPCSAEPTLPPSEMEAMNIDVTPQPSSNSQLPQSLETMGSGQVNYPTLDVPTSSPGSGRQPDPFHVADQSFSRMDDSAEGSGGGRLTPHGSTRSELTSASINPSPAAPVSDASSPGFPPASSLRSSSQQFRTANTSRHISPDALERGDYEQDGSPVPKSLASGQQMGLDAEYEHAPPQVNEASNVEASDGEETVAVKKQPDARQKTSQNSGPTRIKVKKIVRKQNIEDGFDPRDWDDDFSEDQPMARKRNPTRRVVSITDDSDHGFSLEPLRVTYSHKERLASRRTSISQAKQSPKKANEKPATNRRSSRASQPPQSSQMRLSQVPAYRTASQSPPTQFKPPVKVTSSPTLAQRRTRPSNSLKKFDSNRIPEDATVIDIVSSSPDTDIFPDEDYAEDDVDETYSDRKPRSITTRGKRASVSAAGLPTGPGWVPKSVARRRTMSSGPASRGIGEVL